MRFRLKCESLFGDISILDVSDADQIDNIKRQLSEKLNVKYENIGFLYNNQFLFNDKFVRDYQIGNDDIVVYFQYENCARYSISDSVDDRLRELNINIIIDQESNKVIRVFVKKYVDNETYSFNLPIRSTVAHLKKMVVDKMNINPNGIIELVFRGELLLDKSTLKCYEFDDGDTIMAITKFVKGPISNRYLSTYNIVNKLGIGLFGIVFQCKDKSSNQIYALKQFEISKENNSKINFDKQLEYFLAMEKHPRIVEIIKQINDIDSSYLLMEYIDRGSIGSIIKKNGALPETEAAKYAQQILEGLEYLHIHRIIHGNIKGSNILIDGNDNAKLSDFGLRTIFHTISNRNSINEILQSEIGAINWLSPEMIRSGQLVPASDIWSFGAVMVEMITGQIPHYGLSVGQIVFAIMKGQIQFTCPGLYKEHVKAFISICLKAEPRERANFDDLYDHSFLK